MPAGSLLCLPGMRANRWPLPGSVGCQRCWAAADCAHLPASSPQQGSSDCDASTPLHSLLPVPPCAGPAHLQAYSARSRWRSRRPPQRCLCLSSAHAAPGCARPRRSGGEGRHAQRPRPWAAHRLPACLHPQTWAAFIPSRSRLPALSAGHRAPACRTGSLTPLRPISALHPKATPHPIRPHPNSTPHQGASCGGAHWPRARGTCHLLR